MPVVFKRDDRKPPPTMYCGNCSYILNGLMSFNCPECGRAFNPSISTSYLTSKPVLARVALFSYFKTLAATTLISGGLTSLIFLLPRIFSDDSDWFEASVVVLLICLALICMTVTYRAAKSSVLSGACMGTSLGFSVTFFALCVILQGYPMDQANILMSGTGLLFFAFLLFGLSLPGYSIARARAKKNRSATDVRSDADNS